MGNNSYTNYHSSVYKKEDIKLFNVIYNKFYKTNYIFFNMYDNIKYNDLENKIIINNGEIVISYKEYLRLIELYDLNIILREAKIREILNV